MAAILSAIPYLEDLHGEVHVAGGHAGAQARGGRQQVWLDAAVQGTSTRGHFEVFSVVLGTHTHTFYAHALSHMLTGVTRQLAADELKSETFRRRDESSGFRDGWPST